MIPKVCLKSREGGPVALVTSGLASWWRAWLWGCQTELDYGGREGFLWPGGRNQGPGEAGQWRVRFWRIGNHRRGSPCGKRARVDRPAGENELLPTLQWPGVSVGGALWQHELWLSRPSHQESHRAYPHTCRAWLGVEAPAFASSASAVEDTRGVPIRKSVCGPSEAQVSAVGVTLIDGLAAWGVLL